MSVAMLDFNTAGRQRDDIPSVARPTRPHDPARDFLRFLAERGLRLEGTPIGSGKLERCPVADDKPGKRSGWYVFFADDFPAACCGNWKTGEQWNWCPKAETSLTAQERTAFAAKMEQARIARAEERERLAAEAARRATMNWDKAIACMSHPYLSAKGIASHGLRLLAGKLLVPVARADGALRSIQEITAEGEKRFYFGGEKKGCFYHIPGKDKAALCEGYATAASVHEATGWTTLAAFDAGNLLPVGEAWRAAHPDDALVVCGDDDRFNKINTGRREAEACARALGTAALFPAFKDAVGEPTDWNDLHQRQGLEEVKRQLLCDSKAYKVDIDDWVLTPDMFEVEPTPRKDLVENTLPLGAVVLVASLGGIGKSMKMLDLALKVARADAPPHDGMDFNREPMFFGNRILEHGPTVVYTAEDSRADNRRRVFQMGEKYPSYPVRIISLIDAVGSYPLILPGDRNGPAVSPLWEEMREQLLRVSPKLVVFDPLASFALVDLNKPEVANYAIGMFANLASETGACVLVTHHLAKCKENISTPEQARALVRGSTAIVDRTRATYVLWGAAESRSKEICKVLGEKWKRSKVIQGCLAKENFGGDTSIKTFVRKENGLLVARNVELQTAAREDIPALLNVLERACAEAAQRGQPFTRTGDNGLYMRRQELPVELNGLARRSLEEYVQRLLEEKRLVLCIAKGSTSKKWLDAPEGDFALGMGQFAAGATEDIAPSDEGA